MATLKDIDPYATYSVDGFQLLRLKGLAGRIASDEARIMIEDLVITARELKPPHMPGFVPHASCGHAMATTLERLDQIERSGCPHDSLQLSRQFFYLQGQSMPTNLQEMSEERAARFNAEFPVGTPVTYVPVSSRPNDYRSTTIKDEAWALASGHVVVLLHGISGGVNIEHCKKA